MKLHDLLIKLDLLISEYPKGKQFDIWKRELRNNSITAEVVNSLDNIPQYTGYHPEFDALKHVYYVLKAVIEIGECKLVESAFLHDYGKGFTTNIGKNRIYHFGHANVSAKYVDSIKDNLKYYDLTKDIVNRHMNEPKKDDILLSKFVYADKVLSKKLYLSESGIIGYIINEYKSWRTFMEQNVSKKGEVYIMIGISGSGKSSYLKKVNSKYIVSPDDMRRDINGNVSDQSNNSMIWSRVVDLMKLKLVKYGKVYLDATNVNKFNRISLMSNFNGYKKIAVVFNVDVETAIDRVNRDITKGVDRSNVPEDVIRKQYKQFIKGKSSIKSEFNKVIEFNN